MSNQFSRRDFLKTGALSSLALGSGLLGKNNPQKEISSEFGDAKNVIFLVTDGMSSGTMALADIVKQKQFGEKTNWIQLYESDREYHRGLMDMASLDSVVTDSAAAASSWGSGQRINNGAVNWGPNDEEYKTICEIFRDAGKSTGLVTTARITHATPAGFGINMSSRNMEDEIAEQYAERRYDLLMGGGNRHFDPGMRADGIDLYREFEANGYTVVKDKSQLSSAGRNGKLLGIFSDSHMPYTIDHQTIPQLQQNVPTLAEMTSAALERLEQNSDGFLIQIEGARVDHAAHANDAAGLVYDQIAFDDAIKVVMDYTENRDDTLVILATDHGNSNPGLSGMGDRYLDSDESLETLFDYKHSFEWLYDELSTGTPTASQIRNAVEVATQTQITGKESGMVRQAFRGQFEAPFRYRSGAGAVLSGVLANYNGIYFMSTNHTADYVELAAWGPGSDRLPNFVKNTDLFDLMVDMANVRAYAQQ